MDKIFVVRCDWANEYESDSNVTAYSTYKKAKTAFDNAVFDEKENDSLMSNSSVVIEEDENSFSIYEDGYYLTNHCDIKIEELEVR